MSRHERTMAVLTARTGARAPGIARARVVVGLTLALVAGACGGPTEPLNVGVAEQRTDIVLGSQKKPDAPAPAFVPPDLLPPPIPVFTAGTPAALPPPARVNAPTTAPPVLAACPEADPLSVPTDEVLNKVVGMPQAMTYTFRNKGTFKTSGANAREEPYPPESARTIAEVKKQASGGFTFDVASTLGEAVTTTSYRVYPEGQAPAGQDPGIYITKTASRVANGPTTVFDPQPDLLLLKFPAEAGSSWRSAGVDAATNTAIAFTVTVAAEKPRVDACGEFLQAVRVTVDGKVGDCVNDATTGQAACPPALPAQQISPNPENAEQFQAVYDIGTQFGGIPIQDSISLQTTENGIGVSRQNVATINVKPLLASA